MRIRNLGELHPAERGVRLPESFRPTEVGQPGVDAHPSARADQQRIGAANGGGGAGEFIKHGNVPAYA